MKKIFILFVVFFACIGCVDYNSLSQDIIVTDIEHESIREGKTQDTTAVPKNGEAGESR